MNTATKNPIATPLPDTEQQALDMPGLEAVVAKLDTMFDRTKIEGLVKAAETYLREHGFEDISRDMAHNLCVWVLEHHAAGDLEATVKPRDAEGWTKRLIYRAFWMACKHINQDQALSYPATRYYESLEVFGNEIEIGKSWEEQDDTGEGRWTRVFVIRPEKRAIDKDLARKLRTYLQGKDAKGARWLYQNVVYGVRQQELARREWVKIKDVENRLAKMRQIAWEWLTDERKGGCPELLDHDRMTGIYGRESRATLIRRMLRINPGQGKAVNW